MFGASSELASVIEFGLKLTLNIALNHKSKLTLECGTNPTKRRPNIRVC